MDKYILEFIYTPQTFPEIYSYYVMNINDIDKFIYYYKELKINPIKDFLNNEEININNSSYNIYDNNKSDFFIKIENYLLITKTCDLLERFYELFDNQLINNYYESSENNLLFDETEKATNIINLFNNNGDINEIKKLLNENPNLINDNEISEINDLINK